MATAFPIFDLATEQGRSSFEERLGRLRATTSLVGDTASRVSAIIEDVRVRGDDAVVDSMRQWTDPRFEKASLRISEKEFEVAEAGLEPALRESLVAAIANVRAYQEQRGLVARLVNQLVDAQCELLGVILNRPRGTAGGYFKKNFAAMARYAAGSPKDK